jgi:DNA (cytosine-5)-methyltransferase 1
MKLTAGSLFSGIGGIDLAFSLAGFDILFQVEIDEYCRKVLTKHVPEYWPNATQFADIRDVSGNGLPQVTALFGGFPCQDVSHAGQRAGIAEGTRSGLWFEFARIIGELRPRLVLLENVPGLLTRDGTIVIADLAKMGYVGHWGVISAADIGAPHKRERVFIVAYRDGNRQTSSDSWQRDFVSDDNRNNETQEQQWHLLQYGVKRNSQTVGHASGARLAQRQGLRRYPAAQQPPAQRTDYRAGQTVANTQRAGLASFKTQSRARRRPNIHRSSGRRWKAQSRLGRGVDGLSYRLDRHQFPAPPGPQYAWEPPRTTTETENRANRIKALGNAVVPQVVYPIALAIREWLEANP